MRNQLFSNSFSAVFLLASLWELATGPYWNGNSVVAYIPDPNASGGYGTNWRPSPSPDAPSPPAGLRAQ